MRLAALAYLLVPVVAHAAPIEKSIDLGGGVSLSLVSIPHGRFVQGSPPNEAGRGDDEAQRTVSLSQDFWIGKSPVTRGQFARFVAETSYRTEAERGTSGGSGWDGTQLTQRADFNWRNPGFAQTDDHPVVLVTFEDARAFAAWFARKSQLYVALPTEAQWEYACRAGSEGPTYDGTKPHRDLAFSKANAGDGTRPVGQRLANAWGLVDMLGNVHEWVLDYHGPYVAGPIVDPLEERTTLGDKPRRGLRGGSWLRDEKHARCATRYRNAPGSRNADNGFRVVAYETPPASEAGTAAPVATPSEAAPTSTTSTTPESDSGATATHTSSRSGCGRFGVLGFIALLIVLLFRRRSKGSGATLAKQSGGANWAAKIKLRPHNDGFKILAPPSLEGAELHYSYKLDRTLKTGHVILNPSVDGQIVFLGHRPTQLKLTMLKTKDGDVERLDIDDGPGDTYVAPVSDYGSPSAY